MGGGWWGGNTGGEREEEEETEWLCLGKGVTVETQSTLCFGSLVFVAEKPNKVSSVLYHRAAAAQRPRACRSAHFIWNGGSSSTATLHTRDGFREKTGMGMRVAVGVCVPVDQ